MKRRSSSHSATPRNVWRGIHRKRASDFFDPWIADAQLLIHDVARRKDAPAVAVAKQRKQNWPLGEVLLTHVAQ
jgi:hypothetical protein